LRKLDGTKVHFSAKAKEFVLKEKAKTLLIERRTASPKESDGLAVYPENRESPSELSVVRKR